MRKTDELIIPLGLQPLYDAAGPVLRYRMLCDLQDYDDSWIQVYDLATSLQKLETVQSLLDTRASNGTWNGLLTGLTAQEFTQSTVFAILRLCEVGLAQHPIVIESVENALLITLTKPELLWEFTAAARTDDERALARRLVRDVTLRAVTSGTQATNDLLRSQLELILTEWEQFVRSSDSKLWPSVAGYSAVCSYAWDDEEFPRLRSEVVKLFASLEERMPQAVHFPDWYDWQRLTVYPKELYLASPTRLLFSLELSARLGATRDLPMASWLLDELQIRQDADGLVRFEHDETPADDLSWYFPLEATSAQEYPLEYTFRALHIYKMLGYDF